MDFYKYQVIFNPEENNTTVQMQLINQHVEKLGVYIFNEEMLYSNKKYDLEVSFLNDIILFILKNKMCLKIKYLEIYI